MNEALPTAGELSELPLRAVVAIAIRTARRLSAELRGVVPDEVIENVTKAADTVLSSADIVHIDKHSILQPAVALTREYEVVANERGSIDRFSVVFALVQASIAATRAVDTAEFLADANEHARLYRRTVRAAQSVLRVLGQIEPSIKGTADNWKSEARRDYEVLLGEYGRHRHVVIGKPITCFADGAL